MDKALVYGTRDSGFDPQWSRIVLIFFKIFFDGTFALSSPTEGILSSDTAFTIFTQNMYVINEFVNTKGKKDNLKVDHKK